MGKKEGKVIQGDGRRERKSGGEGEGRERKEGEDGFM